ncbi:MAG: adenylyl-sulfate kinase [Verrucomicrobia bacterium]|nr:adenylyl-sulfate kinase [Verrucomicrobiota bacterium]MCH8514412.1 adenylyl-sulfate kinase [Kiritimatiellia bacterium]
MSNLHPEFHRMQDRATKEILLQQKAHVFWFYGLSGSGKTTLATALEQRLTSMGYKTKILDGDNIRSGLNADLGFSDADRAENIRRIAHVARLFHEAGIVVICSFITPKRELRKLAQEVVGEAALTPVYTRASFETCAKRDVHGLYAKAEKGQIKEFTGHGSSFEPPEDGDVDWVVNTDEMSEDEALAHLCERILPMIEFPCAISL